MPVAYDRAPTFSGMIAEKDVAVPMRDGVNLSVDIYRPDSTARSFRRCSRSRSTTRTCKGRMSPNALPPQPAWSSLWAGPLEAGDTKFFVSRGYVHVIGSPRGIGKSDGGGSRQWDSYDLIEWIAQQPWCDGNVGMVGISGFGAEQFHAAQAKPAASEGDLSLRSARRAMARWGASARNIPAACCTLFRYLLDAFRRHARRQGQTRRAAARQGGALARGDAAIPITGCIRTSTMC